MLMIFGFCLTLFAEAPLDRMKAFAEGHRQFLEQFKSNEQEYVRLVKQGQAPKTLFIGCSDSRVIPELITNTKPGDLFVIRNAGNFVSTYNPTIDWDGIAASIQFAVQVLGVKEIIVCGHSHCGAIRGLYAPPNPDLEMLNKWLQWGQEAKRDIEQISKLALNLSDEDKYELTARISILYQMEHLLTYPFIKEQVINNQIHLHGWYFSIDSGQIEFYDSASKSFINLTNLPK